MTTPSIDIVILNWNGRSDTLECLESVRQSTYPNKRVLVVDNGSNDDSVSAIEREHPDISVLCTGKNLGYAGGNNAGLRHCLASGSADFYLCLNNDTTVEPDFLERLVECAARHPTAGVFSPKIVLQSDPEILWFAGARWNPHKLDFHHVGEGERDAGKYRETDPVDYVSGCALFVRAEVLRDIGLFDERYFLLFEEVDYCYRARDRGYRSVVAVDACIRHKVSSSMGRYDSAIASYFYSRNLMLFGETHFSPVDRLRLIVFTLCRIAFPQILSMSKPKASIGKKLFWLAQNKRLIVFADYGRPGYRAQWCGIRDYVFRRFGDCPDSIRSNNNGESEEAGRLPVEIS